MRMTLKEVCNYVGVSRRAIQGYEKAGLVQAIERNKYGHLLYDETALKKILEIKQYQDFRFLIKEIQVLQQLPKDKYLEKMEERLEYLKIETKKMQETIEKLEQLIERKR